MSDRPIIEAHEAGYEFALVRPNGKEGLGAWNKERPPLHRVLYHVGHGGNVAVVTTRTRQGVRLCCIDVDSKSSRLRKFVRDAGYESPQEVITASQKRHIWGRLDAAVGDVRTRIKPLELGLDVKVT